MFFLPLTRAKKLSKQGSHAAALAVSDFKDVGVLANAGMHLSVLRSPRVTPLQRASALAHVGEFDESIAIVKALRARAVPRALWGQLAASVPELTLPLLSNAPAVSPIRRYCEARLGLAPGAESTDGFLETFVALRNHETHAAASAFEQAFAARGLRPVSIDLSAGRVDVSTAHAASAPNFDGPLISVILTAHNEEQHIYVAVRSILEQDWCNLELLIVDDASTDGTLAIAQQLAEEDSRIKIVPLSQNVGTWQAKNLGLRLAKGEFVTMHDADDWSHPAKLASQIQPLLGNPQLMSSSSYMLRVSFADGLPYTRNAASFIRWNPCSLLYRRKVIDVLGNYFPSLLGGDCEFSARIETRWGPQSHVRIRQPLMLGWQREMGLSNRYRATAGRDRINKRLDDWEWWRRLHALAFRSGQRDQIRFSQLAESGQSSPIG